MYDYNSKILAIIDGDTIDVEIDVGFSIKTVRRLRLARIDTDELHDRDVAKKAKAKEAKDYLEKLLIKYNYECMIVTQKTDAFGRYLAELYVGMELINVNSLMITEGLAKIWVKGSKN